MINVIHKDCGDIAFYFREKLHRGEAILSSNVVKIDGSIPYSGDRIICGNCGATLGSHNIEQKEQHWTDWFIIDEVPE